MTLGRFASLMLAALLLLLPSGQAGALNDDSADGRPRLLASTSIGWVEGESRWIALPWFADEGVQDLKVYATSSAPGVEVRYEPESITHAELSNGPDLGAHEIDVTSLQIATTTATPATWQIDLRATWDYRGRTFEGTSTINVVTVSATEEAAFHPLTSSATIASTGDGGSNWVSLEYLGLADETNGVEIWVEGDLPVQYEDELYASLRHNQVLVRGEIDSADIFFDPDRLEPGRYELVVHISYRTDASTVVTRASHPLTITVE